MHRQFAHPLNNRLFALLKDAAVWKEEYEEIIEQINEECELCELYVKTPSRPVHLTTLISVHI